MPKGYVYFTSRGKSTPTTILPSTNHIWLKAKQLQWCFCLMKQNKNSLFYIGGSGLDRTDDFQIFCGSGLYRIQFYRIRIGLGLRNFTVCSSLMLTVQICSIRLLFSKSKSFKKFNNGVIFILVMYKICKYCLSKASLGALKVLCFYHVFGFFRYCLAFFKAVSVLPPGWQQQKAL